MLWVPDEYASTASMRRYKQILQTHFAMTEYMSSIELAGIMDLDLESEVGVKNDSGVMERRKMSLR